MQFMIPVSSLYQSEFVTIEFNQDLSYIQITWLQQPSSDLFRQETKRLADFALQNNYANALFDVRNRDYLDMGDQNWLVRDIFPLFKGRHIRLAYLVSPVGLEIMDTFKIHDMVIHNPELKWHIEIDIFLDKEDALKWLLKTQFSQL
jgi:hypothetical protein